MLVTIQNLAKKNMTLTAITIFDGSLITKMVLLVYSGSGENGQNSSTTPSIISSAMVVEGNGKGFDVSQQVKKPYYYPLFITCQMLG